MEIALECGIELFETHAYQDISWKQPQDMVDIPFSQQLPLLPVFSELWTMADLSLLVQPQQEAQNGRGHHKHDHIPSEFSHISECILDKDQNGKDEECELGGDMMEEQHMVSSNEEWELIFLHHKEQWWILSHKHN